MVDMGKVLCHNVKMWLSHVSVTMSPIWSHVTYHGEITQLRASVPSDDERGMRRGPLHFMHLYRLGLARQPEPEPEDGQAWLRRRPGGTGCSIPCQCPASLRPGDTRYPEHRQQERHGRVQSSSVAFYIRGKVNTVILRAWSAVCPAWRRSISQVWRWVTPAVTNTCWASSRRCTTSSSSTPGSRGPHLQVRERREDVFMIHNLSGMQKLTIKIFEAVQIINVRVKYLTKK